MRVLITGGAGFIGYHLASKLLDQNWEVVLLDNFNDFYDPRLKRQNAMDLQRKKRISLHEVDILDTERLRRVYEEIRPQVVVHLAAWAGIRPSFEHPRLYSEVNITGTVNLLELAWEFKTASFVFGSSSSIYGGNKKTPFSEEDPVDQPISPYAATKRAGELLCHTYAYTYDISITCLRFFTVYGPRQRPEMAIRKFAQLISDGREVPVYGDGQTRRDYTYVDDITSGILAAIRVNSRYEIINLGNSHAISLLELISQLEEALGKKARLRFLPPQAGDMEITFADISKARRILGYQPQTSINEGIRKFVDWFRKSEGADKAESGK